MNIDPEQLPLGFLLNTVGRHILAETEQAVAGLGLSVVELGILWLIDLDEGRTQVEYAQFQKRDLTTFGRYVDALEAKGQLRRSSVAGDRRAKSLWLTDQGRALLHMNSG
jgi:MarR family transcriptional regulator, transcriptional regulator for hemolysin